MRGIAHIHSLNNSGAQLDGETTGVDSQNGVKYYRDLRRKVLKRIKHRRDIKPISNANDSMRILFNGQLYNTSEIQNKLKGKYSFHTDEDGEAVLHLFEEVGEKCVKYLDGKYAFAIYDTDWEDGNRIFIARDPLGIVPLYISENEERVCITSEFKAIAETGSDFKEFPIGSYFQAGDNVKNNKRFVKYHTFTPQQKVLRKTAKPQFVAGEPKPTLKDIKSELQNLLTQAVIKRIDKTRPFGVYLSGGLDSSIIAALTVQEWEGVDSYAVGMEGSEDLIYARLCAQYLGTRHHEYIYSLDEMLEVLPKVIYHLESYDAALVRSAIPNYFLAKMAAEPEKVVLSGEGADELFCGYSYMQSMSPEQRVSEVYHLLETIHGTGLQRGDRMAAAFGMEVRFPFLDMDFVQFSLRIPDYLKCSPSRQEKWLLRKAFSHLLPREIVSRKKEKFSKGAGSSRLLSQVAEEKISDKESAQNSTTVAGHKLKSKEELYYYRIFHEFFPQKAADKTVGFSRSL